jgi:hypothetical protein
VRSKGDRLAEFGLRLKEPFVLVGEEEILMCILNIDSRDFKELFSDE